MHISYMYYMFTVDAHIYKCNITHIYACNTNVRYMPYSVNLQYLHILYLRIYQHLRFVTPKAILEHFAVMCRHAQSSKTF